MVSPIPKPRKRIKDAAAVHRKAMRDRWCRCGCGGQASDGAHVLGRGNGGDDVEENVVGMAHDCHMAMHDGDREVARKVGGNLEQDEIEYVLERLGRGRGIMYLMDRYELEVEE